MSTPSELPGNPDTIYAAARSYTSTAEAVTRAAAQIRTLSSGSTTATSDAMKALSEVAGDVADRLARLNERYAVAGSALSTYAAALTTIKESSRQNATTYAEAQYAYDHAQDQVEHYMAVQRSAAETAQMEHAADMITYWVQQRTSAQQDLSWCITRHSNLEGERDTAAEAAQHQIDEAVDNDGLNDSIWDNISGWVSEHAEFLKKLKDVLSAITAVLSLLSIVFPVLAPFALAAAALTAGLSLLLAASGEISWLEFGLDALALVTLGVGAVAGRVVSQAVKGLKAMRIARVAMGGGSKSAVRVVTGSFNSVQMGKLTLTLSNFSKFKEVFKFKGMANANAVRVFTRAVAGAGPEDAALINRGMTALTTMRTTALVSSVLGYADTAGDKAGDAADIIGGLGLDTISDGLNSIHEGYENLTESTTVRVGSGW